MFFVIKYFGFFSSIGTWKSASVYGVFIIVFYLYSKLYFNVYDRQTQLLANENDICCVFFKSVLNVIRTSLLIIKALIETTRQVID